MVEREDEQKKETELSDEDLEALGVSGGAGDPIPGLDVSLGPRQASSRSVRVKPRSSSGGSA